MIPGEPLVGGCEKMRFGFVGMLVSRGCCGPIDHAVLALAHCAAVVGGDRLAEGVEDVFIGYGWRNDGSAPGLTAILRAQDETAKEGEISVFVRIGHSRDIGVHLHPAVAGT